MPRRGSGLRTATCLSVGGNGRRSIRFRRMRNLQTFAALHGSIHNHFSSECPSSAERHSRIAKMRLFLSSDINSIM